MGNLETATPNDGVTTMLDWFNARDASEIGAALADQFARHTAPIVSPDEKIEPLEPAEAVQELLRRADGEVRQLRLNFYKKAKFANSFKWRLIEKGVTRELADEVTQILVLHVSQSPDGSAPPSGSPKNVEAEGILTRANDCLASGRYAEAVDLYTEFDEIKPHQPEVLNNLGVALLSLGRLGEAEQRYREAIQANPAFPAALCNLADSLQSSPEEAEQWVRRALKINPKFPGARTKLGLLLASMGRDKEARTAFQKALKINPKDADALVGLARVIRGEGRFEEAEDMIKRALKIAPKLPTAWAALQGTRKMTEADRAWCTTAEEIAGSGVSVWEESELRFAIGKYCDDVRDFDRAFTNFKRGNELLKSLSPGYNAQAHAAFADDMIRTYSREALASMTPSGCVSAKPIFVVGMPRSGTSLTEQIIASHPAAEGAGEPDFWLKAARANHGAMREAVMDAAPRGKLAEDYLSFIERHFPGAVRVVDKTPANSDFVGFIHSAIPNARIISMRRDPIDTCLSCYFQHFSTAMTFTMDLSDLANYYRTHRRLMDHWRTALPAGSILEVPYEELVANQEAWTRKILDFLGLEWDSRCLAFYDTNRSVNTASAWQVRQKMYRHSVERWRNYEKFIGPLKDLRA